MRCSRCNTENSDGAKFCYACGAPLAHTSQQAYAQSAHANQFPEAIEYLANYFKGIISVGGKIIITPTQLIFKAHKFNIGNNDRIFDIKDIVDFKGFFTILIIKFANGSSLILSLTKRSEVIRQLEMRRQQLLA